MKLLISVRNTEETATALAGGAEIIDIKEPAQGPLGRADHATIEQIIQHVDGCVPVSAAMGELAEQTGPAPSKNLTWTKLGLSHAPTDWRDQLAKRFVDPAKAVAVAYADGELVGAPSPAEVLAWAIDFGTAAILLDTAVKNGSCLWDHVTLPTLQTLITQAHQANLLVALAGSLRIEHVNQIALLNADILAVRGAVCGQADRRGTIDLARVKKMTHAIKTCCMSADPHANEPTPHASTISKPRQNRHLQDPSLLHQHS